MVEMTLRNLVVGGGPIPSAIILQPASDENDSELVLPISVGTVDAANVARATNADDHKRPATHALLVDTIDALGGELESVSITRVEGATFFATLDVRSATGEQHHIDARPSDAISAAIEADAPVLASEDGATACPKGAALFSIVKSLKVISLPDTLTVYVRNVPILLILAWSS